MLTLEFVIILALAGYGFATAVQMLRQDKLNFKPFNCYFCLSYWFSFLYILLFSFKINTIIIVPFAIACLSIFLKLIEDKLTNKL